MSTVWYIANDQTRVITGEQWADFGIEADTTSWNYQNGWSVNSALFIPEQLDILAGMTDEFLLGQIGPRVNGHPVPSSGAGYDVSAYAYFIRIKEMYDALVAGGGGGGSTDWSAITGKPAVIAAGTTASAARAVIQAIAMVDVTNAIDAVINGAPTNLNTLDELAAALNDDPNFAATMLAALGTKAPTSHTHSFTSPAADFIEAVQDVVAAFMVQGTGVTLDYNDATNTLTISSTGGGGGGLTDEQVRDLMGTTLVQSGSVTIIPDDTNNIITIHSSATQNLPDATLLNRANHNGAQAISTVTGLQPALDLKAPLTSLDLKIDKGILTDTGDLIFRSSTGVVTRLAPGLTGGMFLQADPADINKIKWGVVDPIVKDLMADFLVDPEGDKFQLNAAGNLVIPVQAPPSPPSGPIPGTTASLVDDFTTSDSLKWNFGTGVSVNQGVMSLIADVDNSNTVSVGSFNLTGSSAYCELVQAANNGAAGGNTIFQLTDAAHLNRIVFLVHGGLLEFERVIAGVFTTNSITYDPVQHRFLRFLEGNDIITFQTAPDNVSWVDRWTVARSTLNVTALFYSFEAWSNTGVVSSAIIDNVNKFTAQPPPAGSGDEAATIFGWGTPTWTEDFNYTSVSQMQALWGVYSGPGHANNGTRSPNAWSFPGGGIVRCTGYGVTSGTHPAGESGGMGWRGAGWRSGVKGGRWECRERSAAGSVNFHPVLLLWADSAVWPTGGEMDFLEIFNSAPRTFIEGWNHRHIGGGQLQSLQATINKDGTQWHNWAVEWTATAAKYFCDGVLWGTFASGVNTWPDSMHVCVQLDNFVNRGPIQPPATSTMEVDWIKKYPVPAF